MTTYYHCDYCRRKIKASEYNKDMSKTELLWARDSKDKKDICPKCNGR